MNVQRSMLSTDVHYDGSSNCHRKTDEGVTPETDQPGSSNVCVDATNPIVEKEGRTTDPLISGDKKDDGEEEGVDITDPMVSSDRKEDEETNPAPDGGYGWLVVLGCFLSLVLMAGMERSDGINFLEFQKKFNKSAQLTAWPGALVSTVRLFLGPLVAAVCKRYSTRSACLVGSIIMFVGINLSGLAPNFFFLFLSHSLIEGVGRGLVYAPGLIIVGMYFDKRRSFATGLSSSGAGVGTFLLVPVVQKCFDTYGFQGAFMIISAITLNSSVSAMLYRPLSLHFKFTQGKHAKKVREIDVQEQIVLANGVDMADTESIRSWQAYHSSRLNVNQNYNDTYNEGNYQLEKKGDTKTKNDGCLKSSLKICFPVDKTLQTKNNSKEKLLSLHLLKNLSFLLLCLSILVFTAAFKSAFTFIPALVKSFGFSESEAAFVLSFSGVADTIGRILFGFLFDLEMIRPHRTVIYSGFMFLIAAVSFILPQIKSYVGLCLICTIYGTLTGGFLSQKSVISVDILGVANIASAFGLFICFQGVGICLGPPISGALKDATGSFIPSFYLGGAFMLCAGFLMMGSSLALWRQKRLERRNDSKERAQVE